MQIATVGSKYQIVIPREVRKKVPLLKPGSKVKVSANNKVVSITPSSPKSWSERYMGIAKKDWKNIDTTKYLESLRNEWEK